MDNCNWHLKVDQDMVVQFTFMDVRTFDEYGSHDAVVIQGISFVIKYILETHVLATPFF